MPRPTGSKNWPPYLQAEAVWQYAMGRTGSIEQIRGRLKELHGVDVPAKTIEGWKRTNKPFHWEQRKAQIEAMRAHVRETAEHELEQERVRTRQAEYDRATDEVEKLALDLLKMGVTKEVPMKNEQGEDVTVKGLVGASGIKAPEALSAATRALDAVAKRRGMMPPEHTIIDFTPEARGQALQEVGSIISTALRKLLVEMGLPEAEQYQWAVRLKELVKVETDRIRQGG